MPKKAVKRTEIKEKPSIIIYALFRTLLVLLKLVSIMRGEKRFGADDITKISTLLPSILHNDVITVNQPSWGREWTTTPLKKHNTSSLALIPDKGIRQHYIYVFL